MLKKCTKCHLEIAKGKSHNCNLTQNLDNAIGFINSLPGFKQYIIIGSSIHQKGQKKEIGLNIQKVVIFPICQLEPICNRLKPISSSVQKKLTQDFLLVYGVSQLSV